MPQHVRRIDVDPDMRVGDLLRMLDLPVAGVTVVAHGTCVELDVRSDRSDTASAADWAAMQSACGAWRDLVDLDVLESAIYHDRDHDVDRPAITL